MYWLGNKMVIIEKIRNYIAKRKWRKENTHNFTTIAFEVDFQKVIVGNGSYGELTVYNSGTDSIVKIGNYCSIGPNTVFLVGAEHEMDHVSTYPFKTMILNEGTEAKSKGDIIIDDDVWIGYGAIILSGVHIGQGAVIAAGSIVTKDIPPYAIAAGNPARIIKYRFEKDIINELMLLDFEKFNEEKIQKNISEMYKRIKESESLKEWIATL